MIHNGPTGRTFMQGIYDYPITTHEPCSLSNPVAVGIGDVTLRSKVSMVPLLMLTVRFP